MTAEAGSAVRPRISAIVPTYNAWPDLWRCLDALLAAACAYRTVSVIVVDNGSTDGSYERLQAEFGSRVGILREPQVTVARLRNVGARAADGDVLSFVDSDCIVPTDYFVQVAAVLGTDQADACGAPYDLPTPSHWIERAWHELHADYAEGYVTYLNAGNFAITRRAFERAAGFREDLITGEDAELGQRLTKLGMRIWRTPRVRAVHMGNPKSLGAFYRQKRWHGLGQFGTVNLRSIDRPVAMMTLHATMLVAAAACSFAPMPRMVRLAAFLLSPWLVPAATVVFRLRAKPWPGFSAWLRQLLLYQLYYLARFDAAWRRVVGYGAPRR